jgi:hypothetical protein
MYCFQRKAVFGEPGLGMALEYRISRIELGRFNDLLASRAI